MADDWLLTSIDRVERTGEIARDVMIETIESLRAIRRERLDGVPLSDIVSGLMEQCGRNSRLQVADAWRDFEHAVMMLRAQAVRSLVDDAGLSLSELARAMGVSRQMVSRLYHAAEREEGAEREQSADLSY